MASTEYLRTFWWFVAALPLFGILAFLFGSGLIQVIGLFALLWPFSIPARSVITTNKASKLFSNGVRMVLLEDRIEFRGETAGPNGKPYRMTVPLGNVRDTVRRGDWMLVRTIRLGFSPVAYDAFRTDEDRSAFLARIDEVRAERVEVLSGRKG